MVPASFWASFKDGFYEFLGRIQEWFMQVLRKDLRMVFKSFWDLTKIAFKVFEEYL